MNTTDWTTVQIKDQFADNWQYGKGPYVDWCQLNCTGLYVISKFSRHTITARFQLEKDAVMFGLKWS